MIGLYEIWKKQPFFFLLSSQQLLVEYFPVYLSIICASSGRPLSHYVLHLWSKCLLEMSHHKGRWKVGVTISQLFIASPTGMKVSHLKSPPQNVKGFFIQTSAAQGNIVVLWGARGLFEVEASRMQVTIWPHVMSPACVIVSYSGHF